MQTPPRRTEDTDNVVPLDVSIPDDPPQPVSRLGRGHSLAIAGMSMCALAGVLALLAFITVRWPGSSGETLKQIFVFSGVGFMTCAILAVFFAMRDTQVRTRDAPPRDTTLD